MPKILHASCLGLSPANLAQFTLEMCVAAQNREKFTLTLFLGFKVIRGHWFRWHSKASVRLPNSD